MLHDTKPALAQPLLDKFEADLTYTDVWMNFQINVTAKANQSAIAGTFQFLVIFQLCREQDNVPSQEIALNSITKWYLIVQSLDIMKSSLMEWE